MSVILVMVGEKVKSKEEDGRQYSRHPMHCSGDRKARTEWTESRCGGRWRSRGDFLRE